MKRRLFKKVYKRVYGRDWDLFSSLDIVFGEKRFPSRMKYAKKGDPLYFI